MMGHNDSGDLITILESNGEYIIWNHEHAIEIGTALTLEDANHMING